MYTRVCKYVENVYTRVCKYVGGKNMYTRVRKYVENMYTRICIQESVNMSKKNNVY